MVRGSMPRASGHGLTGVEIVGEEAGDRTDGGLWPSDHAGVVGRVMSPGY